MLLDADKTPRILNLWSRVPPCPQYGKALVVQGRFVTKGCLTCRCLEKTLLHAGLQIILQEQTVSSGTATLESLPPSKYQLPKHLISSLDVPWPRPLISVSPIHPSLHIKRCCCFFPIWSPLAIRKTTSVHSTNRRVCSLTKALRKTWQTLDSLVHSPELFNGLALLQACDQVINPSWHNTARGQPEK